MKISVELLRDDDPLIYSYVFTPMGIPENGITLASDTLHKSYIFYSEYFILSLQIIRTILNAAYDTYDMSAIQKF